MSNVREFSEKLTGATRGRPERTINYHSYHTDVCCCCSFCLTALLLQDVVPKVSIELNEYTGIYKGSTSFLNKYTEVKT